MQVLVVHFADIGGQGLQSGFAGGPPAAFAADNQVASVVGAFDRDGLDYAQRADRVGQLFERLFIELRARCVGLGKIAETEISAISVIGLSLASRCSLPKMASRPRPNPFCFIMLFCFLIAFAVAFQELLGHVR